jgi:tetratricopeptide (TPR) repeat protein
MAKKVGLFGAGIVLAAFGVQMVSGAQQTPAAASPASKDAAPAAAASPASATSDQAAAYYHFMLARRYRDLAGAFRRDDYTTRAISEYQQAIQDDPESLFLRIELADLYWQTTRIADAENEIKEVLKKDPDYVDAHRLLASIYWHSLGQGLNDQASKDLIEKAIAQLEFVVKGEPSDTQSALLLGRLYKSDNQPAKAEAIFKKVMSSDPAAKNGVTDLAQLYFDQGDFASAIDLIKKIPEDAMDPQTYGILAYAYGQNHQPDKAVETYQKALDLDPDNQELHKAYAEALLSAGNTEKARAEFLKILQADSDDGAAYLRLAEIDKDAGRFDDARNELAKAKTLLPDNPEVPYQQALLEDTLGNEDRAIDLLEGLLKQSEKANGDYNPAEANNRMIFLDRLGGIYRSEEKYDKALATYERIVALGSTVAPHGEGLIVETYRLMHQPKKATEHLQAALKQYPKDRSLLVMQANLLGEQGKVDEGVDQLKALLTKGSGDREIYLSIAQVYSQAKKYSEAEAAAKQALDLSPRPEDQEYVYFMLGSIYEREKRYDLAEEQFKKVLAADPSNSEAANYLGYMLADRGVRLEESLKYIQKAVAMEPNNGAYLDSLGWAYYKEGRYDMALPHLEKAARLMADDPTIHEHLGNVYLKQGKEKLAEQEWERALKDWPRALSSDFDAAQAAKLQKQLEDLKHHIAQGEPPQN